MIRRALLLGALAACLALPARSAPNHPAWVTHGPDGGGTTVLEIDPRDPSTIYAGTSAAGVFRSTNGGRSWDRRSAGLPADAAISILELAPSSPARLYAWVYSNGLFTSADAGGTWRKLPRMDESPSRIVVDQLPVAGTRSAAAPSGCSPPGEWIA